MRELAAPGLAKFNQRLAEAGLPRAVKFISTLNGANADFMAYALSPAGPLAACRAGANPDSVEACLADLLIYAVNLFARDEMRRDTSELIPLLARIVDISPTRVMLKRDNLQQGAALRRMDALHVAGPQPDRRSQSDRRAAEVRSGT